MSGAATTFDSLIRSVARIDADPGLAPGQTLGGAYELVERIGGGGMGVVFRARDLRLGRQVAVKTLRPAVDESDDALRLFEREARATAQLLHPNIVTLHHVGVHQNRPFLVLELLTGETLAALLTRRRSLSAADAIEILDQVLAAVAFAHKRGVLHRDLKPNNVFITTDERVKVLDFGIALSLDSAPGPVTRAAGTPGYMAPEQRDGRSQDTRTDVWAAALLLVECVLGHRPDENGIPAALAELPVSPAVIAVLARALDADPAKRPTDASELRSQLAVASGHAQPSAVRPWRRAASTLVLSVMVGVLSAAVAYRARSEVTAEPVVAGELGTKSWHVAAFGDLLLRVEPTGEAYGVYEHDDGILIGTFADGQFTGRWCEQPTQHSPDDAGRIALHFIRDGDHILLNGSWTYGTDDNAPWQRDFLGISTELAAISPLEKRMQHRLQCPGK